MAFRRLVVAVVAVALLVQATHARTLQGKKCGACVKTVIVIGDSISDAGMPHGLWSLDNKTVPLKSLGYNNGRFTNGKVWCEIFSRDKRVKLTSYAVGSATVNNVTAAPGMLSSQGTKYFSDLVASDVHDTVIVIQGGSNDLLYLTPEMFLDSPSLTAYLSNIAAGLATIAQSMLAAGHRSIVIANLPPPELSPEAKAFPELVMAIAQLADIVNDGINNVVKELSVAAPSARIMLLDWNKFVHDVVAQPSKYGMKNVVDSCLVTNSTLLMDPTAVKVSVCKKPDQYLFWDNLHPTSGGHAAMSRLFATLLKKNDLL